MAKVIVFGGTGYAGGRISAELASRGHQVTAVARHAKEVASGVEVRTGSIHDAAFVTELVKGADQIVVALRAEPGEEGEPKLIDALPLLTEVSIANGARLSFVGGAGSLLVAEGGPALIDTPEFPDAYKGEAGSHREILEALRVSDEKLDWFYVSPAAEFGSWVPGERVGSFRVGGDVLQSDAEGKSFISGDDYAIAYVDEIEAGAHRRERISVAY
ncbi:NAD(P)H-binding protein [Kineosporia sp. J2-2]|uniref:NAD(P)H-binding protein n=1 Tax=Kineosporia corallincola TaxID=2835133 RepID=A0ABS5TFD7_9ACTN|nr:NAD(P)H-binding protein [Kineosporia corallincola]MBT0768808.1 NAD(P)H-binding protein [Kineosporia corallincola]